MSEMLELMFDFQQAVAQSLRDYPQLSNDALFISTAAPDKIHGSKEAQQRLDSNLSYKREVASQTLLAGMYQTGMSRFLSGVGHVLIFSPDSAFFFEGVIKDKGQTDAFCFFHEFGHIVCPSGMADGVISESVADAYAALRCLQKYGPRARGFLSRVAWQRAAWLVSEAPLSVTSHSGTADYATMPVIYAIIAQSRHCDYGALTPAQTVALAENMAFLHSPTLPETTDALASFGLTQSPVTAPCRHLSKFNFDHVLRTCLSTRQAFTFMIGATVLHPFLDHASAQSIGVTKPLDAKLVRAFSARFSAPFNACAWRDALLAQREDMNHIVGTSKPPKRKISP